MLTLVKHDKSRGQLGSPVAASPLAGDWALLETAPGAIATPSALPDALADNAWMTAVVPGTVAQALQAAGKWSMEAPGALHGHDYWYRVRITGKTAGAYRLRLRGLATVAEVWLDERRVLETDNMFSEHEVDLWLDGEHWLSLCFRSLHRALRGRRGPARWKPRMVSPPTLRLVRTTLLGHMPGWCPPIHAVGPWRDIELFSLGTQTPRLAQARFELDARLDGDDGCLHMRLRAAGPFGLDAAPAMLADGVEVALTPDDEDGTEWQGTLRLPKVRKWWPHTHGDPALYPVRVRLADEELECARVGFRTIEVERGADGEGFGLRVNGESVFCRGANLSSIDPAGHQPSALQSERWLTLARDGNMNMVRVSGVTCYQSEAFYAACDALGMMVWQDFMFANFDYSGQSGVSENATAAAPLMDEARREVNGWLAATRHHPCVAVLCGGSEVEQQAAMMGVTPAAWRQPLFDEIIPSCIDAHRRDAAYVRNSPSGGAWPFVPESGVTHYYGVGAYQRPLDDARRANVRFASECLAFANVPSARTLREALPGVAAHEPRWKARVPRDAGTGWDFDDVRDFYLRTVYDIDPARLRYEHPDRYLQLSRAVVAEVMTEVFSEWRRAGSGCTGGLVWQYQDMLPGAGWGIVDAFARPKSAWHALRQVWQPVQVLLTDEGLNGVHVHLINETGQARHVRLRLQCLRDGETAVVDVERALTLAPRSSQRLGGAALNGGFFDFTYAYRFGPPAHDVVRAALFDAGTGATVSEAFYLPDRRAAALEPPELSVCVAREADTWWLTVSARRFARWVHIDDANFRAEDDWFHLAPGASRRLRLIPDGRNGLMPLPDDAIPMGEVFALNARRPAIYSA
jgi:beta-mannosidase